MIETVFRSEDVPAEDRFEAWRELVQRAHAPVELESEHREDFQATLRLLEFGGLTVWPSRYQPARFVRTARLVRQSDPERINISLPIRGSLNVISGDHQASYDPYHICFIDSSQTMDVRVDGVQEGIAFDVPRDLIPLPTDKLRRLRGHSAQEGFGALLTGFLTQLVTDTDSFRPSDGPRLATVAIDLVAALFASALDAERSLPPESRTQTLMLRIQAFIRAHLHDPALTPTAVAAAHHISVRHLHRLFRDQDATVTAMIRRLRLEATCRDLADPAHLSTPIGDIALRWGFASPATFTRSFHHALGLAPREFRHHAVDAAANGEGDAPPLSRP
ncbi:helix-turn-helix domain-containing protein [Streptomyces sp. NPDC058171]